MKNTEGLLDGTKAVLRDLKNNIKDHMARPISATTINMSSYDISASYDSTTSSVKMKTRNEVAITCSIPSTWDTIRIVQFMESLLVAEQSLT